jgi:hypothetical protein
VLQTRRLLHGVTKRIPVCHVRQAEDTVLLPFTAAQRTLSSSQFSYSVRLILLHAASEQMMARAERAMTEPPRERHRLPEGADLDFTVRDLSAVPDVQGQTKGYPAWNMRQRVLPMMERPVRIHLIALIAALALAGCGRSSDAAKASGKARLYDTQRGALEKAKGVNDTLRQADQSRRAQEESQTQ